MNQKEVIEKLKERVAKDPVAKDVCYVWAMRQRARAQVTTDGLSQRMKEEKFEHEASDYNAFLKFLGSLGLGKVESMGKGRVRLKEVKVTLQSIGAAASGAEVQLNGFKQRNKFTHIQPVKKLNRRSTDAVAKVWAAPETKSVVSIAYDVGDGRLIYIPVPRDLGPAAIAQLVSRLQEKVST